MSVAETALVSAAVLDAGAAGAAVAMTGIARAQNSQAQALCTFI
ncbi:MAG TPA: hypothetical protein VFQ88_01895 [Nevskiaceae bacterium]|nr:hypothetical protein [Nevskiaceae bacterium]